MRLIDADELIKVLKGRIRKPRSTMEIKRDIIPMIEAQQTAYDIKNVVCELEKKEQYCVEMLDLEGQMAIVDAIEIVKHGGVSDI